MKSIAIMQPYFFPYLGYFQLINYVDKMIIYDDIKFTKKGWINRNKLKSIDGIFNISIPLKKGSSNLSINERYISDQWPNHKKKIINKITNSYKNCKYFDCTIQLIKDVLDYDEQRLDKFLFNSIKSASSFLNINTKIIKSSEIELNSKFYKGPDRVIEIIKLSKADRYVNPINGKHLYKKNLFKKKGITLNFLETNYHNEIDNKIKKNFTHLSIIDIMMNASLNDLNKELKKFKIK